MMLKRLSLLATLATAVAAPAQDDVVVLSGAKIYPASKPPIEDGVIIFTGGLIQTIGEEPPCPSISRRAAPWMTATHSPSSWSYQKPGGEA